MYIYLYIYIHIYIYTYIHTTAFDDDYVNEIPMVVTVVNAAAAVDNSNAAVDRYNRVDAGATNATGYGADWYWHWSCCGF